VGGLADYRALVGHGRVEGAFRHDHVVDLLQEVGHELELIVHPRELLVAGGFALFGELEKVVASTAAEALRGEGVEDLHLRPLGVAAGADVFLGLVDGVGVDLHVLVGLVDAPLDGVDGLAVVDVVVGAADGAGFALLHFWTAVDDEEARVAQGGAELVQVFEVHLH